MTELLPEKVKTSVVTGIIFVSVGINVFICNKPPLLSLCKTEKSVFFCEAVVFFVE